MISNNALTIVVCGAAASVNLPNYLQYLCIRETRPLRVFLTTSAERFVKREVIPFYADELITSDMSVNPTEVAMRSRTIVVLPCTLNFLAASALGLASTPALTTVACFPGRVMFFPSMHSQMWKVAKQLGHVERLRDRGHVVVDPHPGPLYEFWRKGVGEGLSLPAPEEAGERIVAWDNNVPKDGYPVQK